MKIKSAITWLSLFIIISHSYTQVPACRAKIKTSVDQAYSIYYDTGKPIKPLSYIRSAFQQLSGSCELTLDLQESLYDSLFNLVDTIFVNHIGSSYFKVFLKSLKPAYAAGLDLYFQQYRLKRSGIAADQFLKICEKSKAISLHASQVLEAQRTQVLAYQKEINLLRKKKRAELKRPDPDYDGQIRRLDSLINDYNADLNSLTSLNQIVVGQTALNISALQGALKAEEALLLYQQQDSALFYTLAITKDSFHIYALEAEVSFNRIAKTYLNHKRIGYDRLLESGRQLYQTLFQPFENLVKLKKRLFIVRDGVANQIPFDGLIYQRPLNKNSSYAQLDYLARRHSIVYLASSKLFLSGPRESFEAKNLIVSPVFDEKMRSRHKDLLGDSIYQKTPYINSSVAFANYLGRRYDMKILKRYAASISNFKELGRDYNFIHLDAHTSLNEQDVFAQTKIAFAPEVKQGRLVSSGFFSINDVYSLKLAPEVLILGSCNTGVGRNEVGEGVVSIAYNFHLLGVKNIIYSNWSIEETATHEILKLFYQNLEENNEIDYALQRAKIEYLEKNASWKNAANAAPFFWAGLTLSGIPLEARVKKNSKRPYWGIGILLLILFLFYRYRVRAQK